MTLRLRHLIATATLLALLPGAAAQNPVSLVNPSFEEPGFETRDWTQIPGWNLANPPGPTFDSGVGNNPNFATDGEWIAWLQSDDGPIYQLTDYTIQAGDVITLQVDARNSWQTTTFDVTLYYDDGGTRVPAATTTFDFEGITNDVLETISVTLNADAVSASIGKRLGVLIVNTSDPDSYVEMDNVRVSVGGSTAAEPGAEAAVFTLEGSAPNPFSDRTTIAYTLREPSDVRLDVYDLLGRHVVTLVDARQASGPQRIGWNAQDDAGRLVANGLYIYRLTATSATATASAARRVTVIR